MNEHSHFLRDYRPASWNLANKVICRGGIAGGPTLHNTILLFEVKNMIDSIHLNDVICKQERGDENGQRGKKD